MMESLYELIKQAEQAKTVGELRVCHDELARRLRLALQWERLEPLSHIVSDAHDVLMKRAFQLAEEETLRAAVGIRPRKWCWYVMGSLGRREPTIWTDQDHGILFECGEHAETECYEFVRHVAAIGTNYLYEIGYPYCPGYVMATNKRWGQSLHDWENQSKAYIRDRLPNDIRFLFIAIDMRPIYGDSQLVIDSRKALFDWIHREPQLLRQMGEHVMFPAVPLGWFNNVQTERWGTYSGSIHMKHSGYVQIVNSLKWLSCFANISAATTLERWREITNQALLPFPLAKEAKDALSVYYYVRLKYATEAGADRDYVLWRALEANEQKWLKKAMRTAKRLQQFVARQAGGK
ncbi:Putative nucleotidyltransferase substrate binding domain-containing protein [Parageobacillus thermantarcticus]|uniref:Putative nucleotidyltransferase substrate binding domain-containing protein n=2 Tax=Parageobacillus thermantarcticus TaxID=186116 RepID=A0A1I0TD94_9BACL|nr:Putative nucleotidyltransferase substrate binding domain-containing protein [Parageobacillus thermantarcticus]